MFMSVMIVVVTMRMFVSCFFVNMNMMVLAPEAIDLLTSGNLEMEKRRIRRGYWRASNAIGPVWFSPRKERLGMENQGGCTEVRNPARLKRKRGNPDRLSCWGFALNKNRQSWRL
jgi:hypothetical protein